MKVPENLCVCVRRTHSPKYSSTIEFFLDIFNNMSGPMSHSLKYNIEIIHWVIIHITFYFFSRSYFFTLKNPSEVEMTLWNFKYINYFEIQSEITLQFLKKYYFPFFIMIYLCFIFSKCFLKGFPKTWILPNQPICSKRFMVVHLLHLW